MREKTIVFISVVVSIFGLLFLSLISLKINPEQKNPAFFEEGDYVLIKGEVINSAKSNETSFVTLKEESEIEVIVFDEFPFKKGQHIEIAGKVEGGGTKKQVIADKVKIK